jgi:hypothetical protein
MDESLASLSDPRLDLASMLCEAVTAIRLYLHEPELPLPARLSGIAHVVDELCPPPGPAALTPLGDTGQVAERAAAELRSNPGPATALLERLAGEDLWITVTSEGTRLLDDGERQRLHAPPGTEAYARTGHLITVSGIPAARTSLTVIPSRLPEDILAALGSDVPFGALCGPERLGRRFRAAAATGGDPAVRSTAVLVVDGELAGIASEWISEVFCTHVVALDR